MGEPKRFDFPIRISTRGSKHKATIAGRGSQCRPQPGAFVYVVYADSVDEAWEQLRRFVVPGDPRPILGYYRAELCERPPRYELPVRGGVVLEQMGFKV